MKHTVTFASSVSMKTSSLARLSSTSWSPERLTSIVKASRAIGCQPVRTLHFAEAGFPLDHKLEEVCSLTV